MKLKLLSGLIAGIVSGAALSFEPFVIKDIRVEGVQRTEPGTVFGYLPVKVGDTVNEDKVTQSIKALFATGFFKDVRIETERDVLVVVLEERPAIAQIDFTGLKEFDKDAIKKAMKEIGLAESRIFDRALLDKAEQELKRQYLSRGKYAARVTTTVTPMQRNRVGINFEVDEGDVARIRQIHIVGAKSFEQDDLLDLFQLRTPNWMSWYTKDDQYSRQKLTADIESLKSFYLNRGFIEFEVESTQVSISHDKRDIFVTINVKEGDRYAVSSVKVAGELVIGESEYKNLVTVKAGDVFSREKLNQTTKAIADRLGAEGYAFANVNAAPELNREKKQVDFTLYVDPGRRVYVRRINVAGNSKTRDEVIRREMRQMENSWFDAEKISKSRERVDRLGYFSEVNVETPPVQGSSDQVDVNLSVTERPTGSLSLGAGFSSTDKFIISTSITQDNLFGSGNHLALNINTSKVNKTYAVSYTNPYFTVDGVSAGVDLYQRSYDGDNLRQGYKSSSSGAGLRLGYPISDNQSVSMGLGYDATKIKSYDTDSSLKKQFIATYGESSDTFIGSLGWSRNTTDSHLFPAKGSLTRVNLETGLPGAELQYYRFNASNQTFLPLAGKFILMASGEVGAGNGWNGKPLPFYKNYFVGGIGSVRGYESGTLGPIDGESRVGGTRKLTGTIEAMMSFAGLGQEKNMRLGVFIDGGQVWGAGQKFDVADLRYSTGVSLSWLSPIGPLRFSLAQPLNKKSTDKVERFQFQMGTTF